MKRFLLFFMALMLVGPVLWAAQPEPATKPDGSKYKIFVQDVRLVGIDAQYASIYSSFISQAIQDLRMFEVVTSQDLQELIDYEQVKEVLACDSVSCLAEIGGVALADMMLTCNISKFPDNISVALNLSSVESLKKIKTSTEMLLGDTLYKVNQLLPLQTKSLFSDYLTAAQNEELKLEIDMIKGSNIVQMQKNKANNDKKRMTEQEYQKEVAWKAAEERQKAEKLAAAARKRMAKDQVIIQ